MIARAVPANCPPHLPRHYRAVELSPDGPRLMNKLLPAYWDDVQLVVKPLQVGICRSDLKEVQDVRPVRRDFGHEIVGTIEWSKTGSASRGRGSWVCLDPHIAVRRTSGFAELVFATGTQQDLQNAFPQVPSTVSPDRLVFCEPLACAYHCVSNIRRHLGKSCIDGLRVGIVGAGNAGVLIGLILRHFGAKVAVYNRGTARLCFIQERRVLDGSALGLLESEVTGAWDVVVPATSFLTTPVLEFAAQAIRREGLLLLYGGTRPGDVLPRTTVDIDSIRRNEDMISISWDQKPMKLGGTHGALPTDFQEALSLLETDDSHFPVDRLISRKVSLIEAPGALDHLAKTSFVGKVVVALREQQT